MRGRRILVIGGGIGGLTAAIALCRSGQRVVLIEREPRWSVYGVGIIQQANVVRAMASLDLIDRYLAAGAAFDSIAVHAPDGRRVATVPSPRLTGDYPPNVGISRRALHEVLVAAAEEAGAEIRLGVVADRLEQYDAGVDVTFGDGRTDRFDIVVAADGIYSATRRTLFPDAPEPAFTGQSVWRYTLPRPEGLDQLHVYNGAIGVGLVPMNDRQIYLFVTTPEPGRPHYPHDRLATAMRAKLADAAPPVRALAENICDDEGVIYRPLEHLFLEGPWHEGRVVLLGDAVHSTTPHLGQGAGLAIEDAIVLAEELARHDAPQSAFVAYRDRRHDRCRFVCDLSLAICRGQLGAGPPVDNAEATAAMFARTAQPI